VPAAMLGQMIHHGVSRNVRHISVIVCVSAVGEALIPYLITSQNSSTVQEHFQKQGVRFDRDFTLKINSKPYLNTGIFLDYIRTVFLPYIDTLHGLAVFAREDSILLMDNCSAYVSDDAIRILTEAMVHGITLHHIQLRSSKCLISPF
jgi:hypothetical protein